MEKYRWFAYKLVSDFLDKYPTYEYVRDELHAVAFYCTSTLINKFKVGKGVFYAYWKKVALREIDKFIKNNIKCMTVASLDFIPNNTIHALHDVVGIEDKAYEKDMLTEIFYRIMRNPQNRFSKREKEVLSLYLDGYELKLVAELLHISVASAYRIYHKAINKIAKVMRDPIK